MFTDKHNIDGITKLEEGDMVECVKTRGNHFIEGKEYRVTTDGYGDPLLATESRRYALMPKRGGYCSTFLGAHWFRKKEKGMYKEFKAGDLVFELSVGGKVLLSRLGVMPLSVDCVSTESSYYTSQGVNEQSKSSRLFHATKENRQALVTLYGEDAVPKLELTGGEAVKHLLGLQKWVLCQVSNDSEAHAREGNVVALIDCADTILPFGSFYDGGDDWDYAVPIDMNGEEITISLVGWD